MLKKASSALRLVFLELVILTVTSGQSAAKTPIPPPRRDARGTQQSVIFQ